MRRKFPLFLLLILFFVGLFLRIKWQKPAEILPKNQKITFEATLKNEPKSTDRYQVLTIADAKIYAQFFPKYEVGDRLRISGKVAQDGRVFYPEIEKVPPTPAATEGQVDQIMRIFAALRRKIAENFNKLLPLREATLLQGTVVGVDNIDQT
ncbi:MAG: hypothetical protein WD988_00775, partial [Candidatus Curtissbacteria bacterium]